MAEEEIKKMNDEELIKGYYAEETLMEIEIGMTSGYLSDTKNIEKSKEAAANQQKIEDEIIERLKKTKNPAPFLKAIKDITQHLPEEMRAKSLLDFFENFNIIKRLKHFKATGRFRPKAEQKQEKPKENGKKSPPK